MSADPEMFEFREEPEQPQPRRSSATRLSGAFLAMVALTMLVMLLAGGLLLWLVRTI
ncbi:hypothetical protein OHA21_47030 [Actinoplanes sp. NBC_00393]|uniref:hypothetical protein n=1 Tax=Actinoplanes sp. NBC_00393 TaxID=2975953 RepID=UPI002E1A44B2